MDFPLIYCNGCSYSDENYRPELKENTYANRIKENLGHGFVLNSAKAGSNNNRIIRTSLYDLHHYKTTNPTCQQIIAFIQLTFEIRGELWVERNNVNNDAKESDFITHQFSGLTNWKKLLLQSLDINPEIDDGDNGYTMDTLSKNFLKKYSEGKAFFYSPYQERINLFSNLAMFDCFCKYNNIDYIIFQGPKAEKLQGEHLLDFFKAMIPQKNIIDLEEFGFCDWCAGQGFIPYDDLKFKKIGHYKKDAHYAFADNILMPKLKKMNKK